MMFLRVYLCSSGPGAHTLTPHTPHTALEHWYQESENNISWNKLFAESFTSENVSIKKSFNCFKYLEINQSILSPTSVVLKLN